MVDALSNYLRDLLILKTCGAESGLLVTAAEADEAMKALAARFPADALLYMLQVLADARGKLKFVENQQVVLEVAMIRLARWAEFESFDDILGRIANGGAAAAGENPTRAPRAPISHNTAKVSDPDPPDAATAIDDVPPDEPGIAEESPAPENADTHQSPPSPAEQTFAFAQTSPAETWNKAVDQMYNRRGLLATALAHGQLLSFDGENVLLGFPPDARFFMEQLQDPGKRRDAEAGLGDIMGRKITLRCQEIDAAPELKQAAAVKPPRRHGIAPIVKRALEIFNGQIE